MSRSTMVDLSERKRAEQALQDSEALYRSLVESLPLAIYRKDLQGQVTFANQRFCRGRGQPLAQVLGQTDFELYPRDLAEKYRQQERRVLETGQVVEEVQEHPQPGGERSYFQALKAPVYDCRGQVIGTQGILWDITASKQAEEALRCHALESHVARLIQQKLYPAAAPRVPGFDIGGASYPAQATGGDYFDFFPLLDQRLGVVVGDVSGHGSGPALLMAATRAYLRGLAKTERDVSKILALANQALVEDTGGEYYVTLFLGCLDPRTRSFRYASAGHPTGYLCDASGAVRRRLPSTGVPLGLFPDCDFPCGDEVTLEPGDILFVVTDGVVEAAAPCGTAFGAERALSILRLYRGDSARHMVDNLYYAVRAFSRQAPQLDDITAVVVKVDATT
jgi:sigma-B regulation protein RsbU (phosphoserine phosphatase)